MTLLPPELGDRDSLEALQLQGPHDLLKTALITLIRLATCFSRDHHTAKVTHRVDSRFLRVQLELDAWSLSPTAATSFFELGSAVRSASPAESLGLAPVVAQKIISSLGGAVRIVPGDAKTGTLEVQLRATTASPPAGLDRNLTQDASAGSS